MDFDLDAFYYERDRRLNMPDEGINEYLYRLRHSLRKSQELHACSSNELSQSYESHHTMSIQSQPQNRSETRPDGHSRASECITSLGQVAHIPSNMQLEPESVIEGHSPQPDNLQNGSTSLHGRVTPYLWKFNDESKITITPKQCVHFAVADVKSVVTLRPSISSAVHVVSVQPVVGGEANSHIGEVVNTTQVPHAPSENQDPPTSPIEDVSESLLKSPKEKIGRAHTLVHPQLNVEVKVQATKRATFGHEILSKLGHHIKDIQVTSETLFGNKPSSDESSIIDDASSRSLLRARAPPDALGIVRASTELKLNGSKIEVTKKRVKERKDKERIKQILPEDYARTLMNKAQPRTIHERYAQFLIGKHIFYTGGDMNYATERTRGRMEIIVRHGGNLIPKFDAAVVTHIVTDAQLRPTMRALGLKSLDDIPDHIPTVKWSWIVSGIGRTLGVLEGGSSDVKLEEVWLHAAFSKRINAGISRASSSLSKGKMKDRTIDISNISQFSQDGNSGRGEDADDVIEDVRDAPTLPLISIQRPAISRYQATSSKILSDVPPGTAPAHDPLGEFYAKAKAAREGEWSRHAEAEGPELDSDHSDFEFIDIPLLKRGWTCDKQEEQRKPSPNQDIIDKLQELMELHKSKPGDEDRWRAFSYSKCIRGLKTHPRRIRTFSEARSIRGIGERTALKASHIHRCQLRRIEYENTDDVKVTRLFQGQSTAFKWYTAGCRTLEDLVSGKGGVKLNQVQEIGIKYYSDVNSRMPRDEAKGIFDLIKPIALRLDPKLFVEIMGSFRRGKADCGDIDILITRPTDDGKTHSGILSRLLQDLHAARILTEDLALPEDPNDLEAIYHGLCRLPEEGSRRRRIDFLTVPWHSRGAALLYYTFNRAMRMKAKVMGYSLNQRGLFAGVVRDPHDWRVKTNPGKLVASETEEEIFKTLEVPWQEPHERVRG
ncbi:hypothetical protein AX15_006059 [Amanita polypyramis BW_CC]|nr:hypothetical protein AX15_006059 [Amanita polypyramis BW_CC]